MKIPRKKAAQREERGTRMKIRKTESDILIRIVEQQKR
jgi:hypothetical protein